MGITIVQKSDLSVARPWAPKALVLSGGALTGASFKAGGLKALNESFVNFSVNDFDLLIGVSSGSLVATALLAGLTPDAILASLTGTSKDYLHLAPWHLYWPNWKEFLVRPAQYAWDAVSHFPRMAFDLAQQWFAVRESVAMHLWKFVCKPSAEQYAQLITLLTANLASHVAPTWLQLLPTGLFTNEPLEKYLRKNIERNHLTNNFREALEATGKRLYICAMTLDGAQRVIFGPDERNDVSISEAVQASTALPVFYKPARIGGVDYVDGGVFETAHIDVAIKKGAQLIICYNPFRPIDNDLFWEQLRSNPRLVSGGRPLSRLGISAILNQIFRTIFHTRLQQAMQHYRRDEHFKGDIILIEPRTSDVTFFEMNPMLFSHRARAAEIGFSSVRESLIKNHDQLAPILQAYGITMQRMGDPPAHIMPVRKKSPASRAKRSTRNSDALRRKRKS